MNRSIIAVLLLLAFFASGMATLVHEVIWMRLLRVVMGNTTVSITTVLTLFMAGLALGSYGGGRIIDRRFAPLKVFALIEVGIGLYCLLLPQLIAWSEPAYRYFYLHTQTGFYGFSLIRFVFCGMLLLLPATLMGATLPVLSRWFVQSVDQVGRRVGTLYAINTFGAVAGAFLTGFVFIPNWGVSSTIYFGCAVNFAVAIMAWVLHRATAGEALPAAPRRVERTTPPAGKGWMFRILLLGYACSGFVALVYEVTWSRVLSLIIGSSVYAFSLMLTAFILGLGLGSLLFARFIDRLKDPVRALALAQFGIGLSAFAVVPLIGQLPIHVTLWFAELGDRFALMHAIKFGVILLVMLVPTTLMGAAFPLAGRIFVREHDTIGQSIGTVYGANTLGSIAGSFAGGFLLIPFLGIQNTLYAAALINLGLGLLFLFRSRSGSIPRIAWTLAMMAVAGAGVVWLPKWKETHLAMGPFVLGHYLPGEDRTAEAIRARAEKNELVFYREGLSTTVAVTRDFSDRGEPYLRLITNGRTDASSDRGGLQQRLLAHLPLLFHEQPKRVLQIGLASGITLASAGLHPVERLDCAELSPGVIEATRLFKDFNRGILDDERVRIVTADGRNHLLLSPERYDVIISQPSDPNVAGVADLFTREFFVLARERLNEGGKICVWLRADGIQPEIFRGVVGAFAEAFDEILVFSATSHNSEYMLLGSRGPMRLDADAVNRRIRVQGVEQDLEEFGIARVPQFLQYLVLDDTRARAFSAGVPVHADRNAALEFSAPRHEAGTGFSALNPVLLPWFGGDPGFLETLLPGPDQEEERVETRQALAAAARVFEGEIHLDGDDRAEVIRSFHAAWKAYPHSAALGFYLGQFREAVQVRTRRGELTEALHYAKQLAAITPDDAAVQVQLSELAIRTRQWDLALRHAERAVELDGEDAGALHRLSLQLSGHPTVARRDIPRAIRLAEKACRLTFNSDPDQLRALAVAHEAAADYARALDAGRKALILARRAGRRDLVADLEPRLRRYAALAAPR